MPSPIGRSTFLLMLATLVISAAAPSARADLAHVILDSAPGSYIGGGKNYDITDNKATSYSVYPAYSLPDGELTNVTFSVYQSSNVYASLTFSTHMLGIALQSGVYNNAQRFPFEQSGHAGLDVTFYDEGSNMLTGSFTITDAQFYKDMQGAYHVAAFAATFDQVSDNNTSHVTGSISYLASVPEPSSLILCLVAGSIGLGFNRVRRKRVV